MQPAIAPNFSSPLHAFLDLPSRAQNSHRRSGAFDPEPFGDLIWHQLLNEREERGFSRRIVKLMQTNHCACELLRELGLGTRTGTWVAPNGDLTSLSGSKPERLAGSREVVGDRQSSCLCTEVSRNLILHDCTDPRSERRPSDRRSQLGQSFRDSEETLLHDLVHRVEVTRMRAKAAEYPLANRRLNGLYDSFDGPTIAGACINEVLFARICPLRRHEADPPLA
jgi:hypothetical protein